TQCDAAAGPVHGVERRPFAAAANAHLPVVAVAFGVDGQHHGLCTKFGGEVGEELGTVDGGSGDGNFVGARTDDGARLVERTDAATCGQGDGKLLGGAANGFEEGGAIVACGGDVEDNEFVGAFGVVARGEFHGITGVAQAFEMDSFDDAGAVG